MSPSDTTLIRPGPLNACLSGSCGLCFTCLNHRLEAPALAEQSEARGFWADALAQKVVSKFESQSVYRTENGIGASGLPHIGSLGDAVRSYAVKLAIENMGRKAEHIAYSDDKDGLRKVPSGMPPSLEKYIGFPVTSVPDPYDCHQSYGAHMGSLLLDGLDKLGLKYMPLSATEVYKTGLLNPAIIKILGSWEKVGQIILEETGQTKYTKTPPYLPVCSNCGRIYTTVVDTYDRVNQAVSYKCSGGEIAGRWVDGCAHSGAVKVTEGNGKLAWKTEFAARWVTLGISFEAYGKELTDSIVTNDRICREVLGAEPPVHARYELFISKTGGKISKSAGNVITHDQWLRYGSPQSLLLLMLKRFEGAREVGLEDIPIYMAEMDELEDIYFGKKSIEDPSEAHDKTSLYRYVYLLNPPSEPFLHPPYSLLSYLCTIAPPSDPESFVINKLGEYGYYLKDSVQEADLRKRISLAFNWVKEHGNIESNAKLSAVEMDLVARTAKHLLNKTDEKGYQQAIYEAAEEAGVDRKKVFEAMYKALIGQTSGPRIGPYVAAMGKEKVVARLIEASKKN